MTKPPRKPHTIKQDEFEKYSAYWELLVAQRSPELLLSCFLQNKQDHSSKMNYASFLPEHLALLLSTVGIQYVEARFVVVADLLEPEAATFALVLYATDALRTRISAYYVGSPTLLPVEAQAALEQAVAPAAAAGDADVASAGDPGTQVPGNIVVSWVHNWLNATSLQWEMFQNKYGPLRGYTFTVGDLIQPLFSAQSAGAWNILFNFGLHEYYGADDTLVHTFGLIIRLHAVPTIRTGTDGEEKVVAAAADAPEGQPFYDMSMPSPPHTNSND